MQVPRAPPSSEALSYASPPAHGEVPQLDHTIVAARHDPAAIGREDDLPHGLCMTLVRLYASLASDIPNLQVGVDRA